jgi:hypothetical protein
MFIFYSSDDIDVSKSRLTFALYVHMQAMLVKDLFVTAVNLDIHSSTCLPGFNHVARVSFPFLLTSVQSAILSVDTCIICTCFSYQSLFVCYIYALCLMVVLLYACCCMWWNIHDMIQVGVIIQSTSHFRWPRSFLEHHIDDKLEMKKHY